MVLFQSFLALQMAQMLCYTQANSSLVLVSDQRIRRQTTRTPLEFQMPLVHISLKKYQFLDP